MASKKFRQDRLGAKVMKKHLRMIWVSLKLSLVIALVIIPVILTISFWVKLGSEHQTKMNEVNSMLEEGRKQHEEGKAYLAEMAKIGK